MKDTENTNKSIDMFRKKTANILVDHLGIAEGGLEDGLSESSRGYCLSEAFERSYQIPTQHFV